MTPNLGLSFRRFCTVHGQLVIVGFWSGGEVGSLVSSQESAHRCGLHGVLSLLLLTWSDLFNDSCAHYTHKVYTQG